MPAIRLTILSLLISSGLWAQVPVKDTTSKSFLLDSTYDYFSGLNDTTINWDAFNFDFDFNWLFPDSASFKKSFVTVSSNIKNGFATVKGDVLNTGAFSKNYKVTTGNMPGTINNYIYEIESFFGEPSPPVYTATIDSDATDKSAAEQLLKWKELLTKVFPAESKKMKETGSDKADKHEYIFTKPGFWNLSIRNYKNRGTRWVELYIF